MPGGQLQRWPCPMHRCESARNLFCANLRVPSVHGAQVFVGPLSATCLFSIALLTVASRRETAEIPIGR